MSTTQKLHQKRGYTRKCIALKGNTLTFPMVVSQSRNPRATGSHALVNDQQTFWSVRGTKYVLFCIIVHTINRSIDHGMRHSTCCINSTEPCSSIPQHQINLYLNLPPPPWLEPCSSIPQHEIFFHQPLPRPHHGWSRVKPVRTPVAILGSLGVCIYVPASRHWLISYSPIHLI